MIVQVGVLYIYCVSLLFQCYYRNPFFFLINLLMGVVWGQRGIGITSKSEQNYVFLLILFFEKISKLSEIKLELTKSSQLNRKKKSISFYRVFLFLHVPCQRNNLDEMENINPPTENYNFCGAVFDLYHIKLP